MTEQHDHDHVRPATAAERGRRRGDARRQPGRLGRGRRALRGLARRGVDADPLGRHEPLRRRDRAHRRPARPLPAGHPPPVRRRPRHAVALEPRRRRGRRRRLQPADARARRAADRGRPARRRAGSCPTCSTRRTSSTGRADLVYTGRGSLIWLQDLDAWAAVHRPAPRPERSVRPVRGPPGRVAVRRRRGRPLDRHRLRLLRRRRGLEGLGARVHRPPVDRRGRPELEVRPGLDARRGHHGAAAAPVCGSTRSPSIRSTGGAATPTSAPRSAAGSRCRSRSSAARAPEASGAGRLRRAQPGEPAVRARDRPGWTADDRRARDRARRCAGTASPRRRSATARRARRGRRSAPGTARGSAA